jgi:hypothetical protein
MSINDNPVSAFGDGRQTVSEAGKAVQLSTTTTGCAWVTITAETDNTGVICVGGKGVLAKLEERRGLPLEKGDTATLPAGDLAGVYIDSTVSGDGVTFIYGVA